MAVLPSLGAGICHPSRDAHGNAPKKLLPAGERLGQELWDHSVFLHSYLNQLNSLALGWSPQLWGASNQGLLDHGGENKVRALVLSLRCLAPCLLLRECSARRRHKHRDVCPARISASSGRTSWDDSGETEGGPCLIFIIPPQLRSHPLIFNSPGS